MGLSISGQTFYTFILENLERFGALKALGTKDSELVGMILFQATFTALTGYGLGVGLCTLFIYLAKLRLPSYFATITYTNLLLALVMVLIIDGGFQLRGCPQGAADRAVRDFQGMKCRAPPSKRAGLRNGLAKARPGPWRCADVDLHADFGEMIYIVGPSGSGKTTLLSVLSGILRPNSGHVTADGTDIWSLNSNHLADFRLHKLGFVFQDFHLFPRLNTAENVAIPLILRKAAWDESIQEAIQYLDIVGLKGRADLPPVKLSGGEQQRVAIARAMIGKPDILIMDEPTASLDGDTGHAILKFVRENILDEQPLHRSRHARQQNL